MINHRINLPFTKKKPAHYPGKKDKVMTVGQPWPVLQELCPSKNWEHTLYSVEDCLAANRRSTSEFLTRLLDFCAIWKIIKQLWYRPFNNNYFCVRNSGFIITGTTFLWGQKWASVTVITGLDYYLTTKDL